MLKVVHTICIPFGIENVWLCIGAHTLSEGAIEGLQGGNMFHGFIMGAVSGAGGYAINNYGQELGRAGKIASSAVLGGVVSEIGGGKFANGAITAAYSMMFNEMMHGGPTYRQLKKIYANYVSDTSGVEFYQSLGGEIAASATANPEYYQNSCAAKLSDAMNKAGFKIPYIKNQTLKGSNGKNYFLRASDMKAYFERIWGAPRFHHRNFCELRNCIVYQTGFAGVSGHVDIFVNGNSASGAYNYFMNKE